MKIQQLNLFHINHFVDWNNVKYFSKIKYIGGNRQHNGWLIAYCKDVDKVGAIIEVLTPLDPKKTKYIIMYSKSSDFQQ